MAEPEPGLVVIGASLAGLRAVEAARRVGYDGPVTVVGAEQHLPYDRPPLSKQFLVGAAEPTYRYSEDELAALAVAVRLGVEATGLDVGGHRVLLADGTALSYSRLVIATGASPRRLPSLTHLPEVVELRTLDDAVKIRARLCPGAEVVVIGAGFIGAELASSARSLGANVTIVEAAPVPLVRAVGEVVGSALAGLHARNGVRLLCSTEVVAVHGETHVESVELGDGEILATDLVVVGVGARPATGWLVGSGVELHPGDGGIVADEYLHSSVPDVYAAGDVVHWPSRGLGALSRLENWTNAADQGARAGINAVAPDQAEPYDTVAYFWSDWYDSRIQFVGSPAGDDVVFASGSPDGDRFVALYRTGDRLTGAATLNEPRVIMKLRRIISQEGRFVDAADLLQPVAGPGPSTD